MELKNVFENFLKEYIERESQLYDFTISKALLFEKWEKYCDDTKTNRIQFNTLMGLEGFQTTKVFKQNYWMGIRWK